MRWILPVIALIFIQLSVAEKLTFHNYSVYSITPRSTGALKILRDWEEYRYEDFNFWSSVTTVNRSVEIMVPPRLKGYVEKIVHTMGMSSKVFMENVQEHIDMETVIPEKRSTDFNWTRYHTLDEINAWLMLLPNLYPGIVTIVQAGVSFERRPIIGVKIQYPQAPQKTVFIESNIHAREWITSAATTYMINRLLTSQDPPVRSVAESHIWYIFPVTNPDGFVFSHTTNRMWRKTRTPNGICFGADPNRNWGYRWNTGGSSSFTCSDIYHGPRPFSEPSTLSVAEYITTIAQTENLVAFISFHSFSQMFLIPYGHTTAHLDNYREMLEVGNKAAAALAVRFGTEYVVGNTAETIYVATGSSGDWVKGVFKTPIVFTYELRDIGYHGFLLPPDQIIPTGLETMDSLVTILQEGERYIPT